MKEQVASMNLEGSAKQVETTSSSQRQQAVPDVDTNHGSSLPSINRGPAEIRVV